jgi:hypothetical protein
MYYYSNHKTTTMKRFISFCKNFFTPDAGATRVEKVLPFVVVAIISAFLVLFYGSVFGLFGHNVISAAAEAASPFSITCGFIFLVLCVAAFFLAAIDAFPVNLGQNSATWEGVVVVLLLLLSILCYGGYLQNLF